MECQRYQHRKNDHETRYFTPDIWSSFALEKQAAKIFTRAIFLDQQMEIDHAINQCAHVMFREEDGYYIMLLQQALDKGGYPNNSNLEFVSYGVSDNNSIDVQSIILEIRTDNEYNLDRLVANIEELYRYRDLVKGYKTKADKILNVNPPHPSRKDIFKSQIQMDEPFNGKVNALIKSSTKGNVKFKHMKSDREIAVTRAG
ncbi:hypothetical protein QVD17_24440 [Tagetes erecta]|uniref:Uncharacterized protein n=1 Tax=Tagetes erecta TaxID=13708 RepID=A0AAD8KF40_TARER|nr:hypothetical protein QVD17_24440 [Tagetes erecta]